MKFNIIITREYEGPFLLGVADLADNKNAIEIRNAWRDFQDTSPDCDDAFLDFLVRAGVALSTTVDTNSDCSLRG